VFVRSGAREQTGCHLNSKDVAKSIFGEGGSVFSCRVPGKVLFAESIKCAAKWGEIFNRRASLSHSNLLCGDTKILA
jgi:hypothetical protein